MLGLKTDHWRWDSVAAFAELRAAVLAAPASVVKQSPAKLVARHHFQGTDYYVKRYRHQAGWGRPLKYWVKPPRSRQEWQLARQLQQRGIPHVPHLAHGEHWSWRGLLESVLITQGPAGFVPLPQVPASRALQRALGAFLRQLHDAGVFQQDLQVSNLLYAPATDQFCLVDLDKTILSGPLGHDQRLRNLAFLGQSFAYSPEMFAAYGQPEPGFAAAVARTSLVGERALCRQRAKRALKHNREFQPLDCGGLRWFVREPFLGEPLLALLRDPEAVLAGAADLLKQGRSTTVGRRDGFVLKRYNLALHKPLRLFKNLGRTSTAKRSYQLAYHLELAGIASAKPVAVADRRLFGWLVRSYFVMQEIAQASRLLDPANRSLRLAKRLGKLIAQLHEEGFSHRDLKPTNILVDDTGQPCLIDLEGVRYLDQVSPARAQADLARLAAGTTEVPARLRAAFLLQYCRARHIADWRAWATPLIQQP